MQPTYRRYVGSFLLGAALIAPAGLRAGVYQQDDRHQDDRRRENKHHKRYYDRDHKDYHDWDDREDSAYRNWRQERNENREFSKLNRKEQNTGNGATNIQITTRTGTSSSVLSRWIAHQRAVSA